MSHSSASAYSADKTASLSQTALVTLEYALMTANAFVTFDQMTGALFKRREAIELAI